MKRSDLPVNCRASELSTLPTLDCRCGRKIPPWTGKTITQGGEPDPQYAVKWVCPDPLCHGPFEG
jgi:hypothetical protein